MSNETELKAGPDSSLEDWLCHETTYLMRDTGISKEFSRRVIQSLMAAHSRGVVDNEQASAFLQESAAQAATGGVDGVAAVKEAWAAFRATFDFDAHESTLEAFKGLSSAIDALAAAQGSDTLCWSKELPTGPGWYWIRMEDEHRTKWAAEFFHGCGHFKFTDRDGTAAKVSRCDWRGYEFAGPIPEPAMLKGGRDDG